MSELTQTNNQKLSNNVNIVDEGPGPSLIDVCLRGVPGWQQWECEDFIIKPLTGGMTNTLWTCSLSHDHTPGDECRCGKRGFAQLTHSPKVNSIKASQFINSLNLNNSTNSPTNTYQDNDNLNNRADESKEMNEVKASEEPSPLIVVLREFGNDTSVFFNRELEIHITMELSKKGVGPKILYQFQGGRIESFVHGRTLTTNYLHVPIISTWIACAMSHLHFQKISLPAVTPRSRSNSTSLSFSLNSLSSRNQNPLDGLREGEEVLKLEKNKSIDLADPGTASFNSSTSQPLLLTNLTNWHVLASHVDSLRNEKDKEGAEILNKLRSVEFRKEIMWLERKLKEVNSPIVFCHNDLQEGNIMLSDDYATKIAVDNLLPFKHLAACDQVNHLPPSNPIDFQFNYPSNASYNNLSQTSDFDKMIKNIHVIDPNVNPSFCAKAIQRGDGSSPLSLIDFEYAGWNYRGFDLANHFCESYIDYSLPIKPGFAILPRHFPNYNFFKLFVTSYLKAKQIFEQSDGLDKSTADNNDQNCDSFEKNDGCSEDTEKGMCLEIIVFMLSSHLMWSFWGIIQASRSSLEFGYIQYALARYNEYLRLKHILNKFYFNTNSREITEEILNNIIQAIRDGTGSQDMLRL